MATIVTREILGAPLSNEDMDNNFINLNRDSFLSVRNSKDWAATTAYSVGEIVVAGNNFYTVTTAGTTSGVAPTHTSGTVANGTTQLQFTVLTAYSAKDVLDKIKTVDGTGSGLDADTLDGLNSASTNTASTVVVRDASGNFSAGTITANLTGTAANAALLDGLDTASTNTASTVVVRDASGNFSAGTITAALDGTASNSNTLNSLSSTDILNQATAQALALAIALG